MVLHAEIIGHLMVESHNWAMVMCGSVELRMAAALFAVCALRLLIEVKYMLSSMELIVLEIFAPARAVLRGQLLST